MGATYIDAVALAVPGDDGADDRLLNGGHVLRRGQAEALSALSSSRSTLVQQRREARRTRLPRPSTHMRFPLLSDPTRPALVAIRRAPLPLELADAAAGGPERADV